MHGVHRTTAAGNFRADPGWSNANYAPFFEAHEGHAVSGICLIRLEEICPSDSADAGLSVKRCHRIAVVWETRRSEGVTSPVAIPGLH